MKYILPFTPNPSITNHPTIMSAIVSSPVASPVVTPLSAEKLDKLSTLIKTFGIHEIPASLYPIVRELLEKHVSLNKDSKFTTDTLAYLYLIISKLAKYLIEKGIQTKDYPLDKAFLTGFPLTIKGIVALIEDIQERFVLVSPPMFEWFKMMHNHVCINKKTGDKVKISDTSLTLWYMSAFKVMFVNNIQFSSFDKFRNGVSEVKGRYSEDKDSKVSKKGLETAFREYTQTSKFPRKSNGFQLYFTGHSGCEGFGRDWLKVVAGSIQKPIEKFSDIVSPNDILNLEKIQADQNEVARENFQEDATKRLKDPNNHPIILSKIIPGFRDELASIDTVNLYGVDIREEGIPVKCPHSLIGNSIFWKDNYGNMGYYIYIKPEGQDHEGKWYNIAEFMNVPSIYYDIVVKFMKNATIVYVGCGCVLCGAQATGQYSDKSRLCVSCIYAIKTGKGLKHTTRMTTVSPVCNPIMNFYYVPRLNPQENYLKLHERIVKDSSPNDFYGDFNPPTTRVLSSDTCAICGQSVDDGRGGNIRTCIHSACAMKELGIVFVDTREIAIKLLSEGFSVAPNAEKLAVAEKNAFNLTQESRAEGCPVRCDMCSCDHADATSDNVTFHFQNSLYVAIPALSVILDAYTMASVPVDSELYPKLCEQFWNVVEEFRKVRQ